MEIQIPIIQCPNCNKTAYLNDVLTAQSNQNVIYECPNCIYTVRDIETSKG